MVDVSAGTIAFDSTAAASWTPATAAASSAAITDSPSAAGTERRRSARCVTRRAATSLHGWRERERHAHVTVLAAARRASLCAIVRGPSRSGLRAVAYTRPVPATTPWPTVPPNRGVERHGGGDDDEAAATAVHGADEPRAAARRACSAQSGPVANAGITVADPVSAWFAVAKAHRGDRSDSYAYGIWPPSSVAVAKLQRCRLRS